ncbi:MAG: TerB family tellurite resistance protein [bacterium]|nr:TerB family tellurite resistance protein [bacterium]
MVSKADWHAPEAEIQHLRRLPRPPPRMSPERIPRCRMAGRTRDEARDSPIPAGDFTRQVRVAMGQSPGAVAASIVTLLLQIAHADGHACTRPRTG